MLNVVVILVFIVSLTEETKTAFVAELERVGRDSIHWVRREASFALGALAKVVPVEVVTSSLVSFSHHILLVVLNMVADSFWWL